MTYLHCRHKISYQSLILSKRCSYSTNAVTNLGLLHDLLAEKYDVIVAIEFTERVHFASF